MRYYQTQEVEDYFELGELTINYSVTWQREYYSGHVYIESIDAVSVYKDNDELDGYYKSYQEEIDELIQENAAEPNEWEEPTSYDLREAYYEQEYGY